MCLDVGIVMVDRLHRLKGKKIIEIVTSWFILMVRESYLGINKAFDDVLNIEMNQINMYFDVKIIIFLWKHLFYQ